MKKFLGALLTATALTLAATSASLSARTDLVLGVVLEPPHLDPTAGAAGAIDEVLYANVFQGLTRIDEQGKVQPQLAKSWEINDDGTVYTFSLQENVKFHDGSDFTADDVKFSFDRARADNSINPQKTLFSAISSVDVVDPHTVKITLSRPQGAFLNNMGIGDAIIVGSESAETNREKPIGTGPFKFDRWAKGSAVFLSKFDGYWGDPVALEQVEFRVIPDAAAAMPALLSGDVQAFPSAANIGDSLPLLQSDPRFKVVIGTTEGETILATNNKKAPFDNLKVRQAIAHAINRDEIILGASAGNGVPIGSHFAPHNPAYEDLTGTYPYDVEKAKALLGEAGLADGFSATLKLPPPGYARQGGEIIASQLRQVGIQLEIIPLEWAEWLKQVLNEKNYDLSIISHTEPNDIDIYARPDYYFGYDNPDFNKVIEQLDVTSDQEQRTTLYKQAQEILARDAVNGFLFALPKVGVWDAKLEGLWENMPIQANDLTKVRWTE